MKEKPAKKIPPTSPVQSKPWERISAKLQAKIVEEVESGLIVMDPWFKTSNQGS